MSVTRARSLVLCAAAAAILAAPVALPASPSSQVGRVIGAAPPSSSQAGPVVHHRILAPMHDPEVERVSSDVRIRVEGGRRLAHVEVEEVFRNRSHRLLEGDYLYPVPDGAVFTGLSLFMGDQELRGEVLPAERARAIYEEIVRRKKDPALVELVGQGVLRARVFPIAPGESRRVTLRYTQVLGRDGDALRLRYPRTVGLLATDTEVAQGPVPVPAMARRQQPLDFRMAIHVQDAASFATPYSPTHTVEVVDRSDGTLEVRLPDGGGPPRDFELFLPLRGAGVGASLITHAPGGEAGFFMLLLSPPAADGDDGIPRDLTLVLDTSGSMAGAKIDQARAALRQVLGGLRPRDRFRLITFSSAVRTFREELVPADAASVQAAGDWLAATTADGGTDIAAALAAALEPAAGTGRMAQVVFLTDGRPTVGETVPERIVDAARRLLDGERVFAFGVGHDVNTWVLDTLVEGGRGAVSYVRPGQDVETAVSSLTRKLGSPALADLRIAGAPVPLEDLQPGALPDLFHGEELVVFGRYRGAGRGDLVIEGDRGDRTVTLRYPVDLGASRSDNAFVPRMWAARKAGALAAAIRLHGADPELVQEIRDLALRYGVVTEYTSYLVEEPLLERPVTVEDLVGRADAAAAPAAAQVGADSFARADRDARLRRSVSLDAAEEELRKATAGGAGVPGELAPGAGPVDGATHSVAGRIFVLRDGTWTDVAHRRDLRVVRIAPFGEAWFALARRSASLRPFLAMGGHVIIAGDGLALELTPDGPGSLGAGELDAVLEAFGR